MVQKHLFQAFLVYYTKLVPIDQAQPYEKLKTETNTHFLAKQPTILLFQQFFVDFIASLSLGYMWCKMEHNNV